MTFEDLEKEVIDWAYDRGIMQNCTPPVQLLKTMSELGELADALIKGDIEGIEDGIGDVMVTLVIVASMMEMSVTDSLRIAYDQIKDRKGFLNSDGVFVKEE